MGKEWHFDMVITHMRNEDVTDEMMDQFWDKFAEALENRDCGMMGTHHPIPGESCDFCRQCEESDGQAT